MKGLFDAVKSNLISGQAYYLIAKGVLVTIIIVLTAWVVAFLIGSLLSYYMCYKKKVISFIAEGAAFFFRSVPFLLLLLLMHYVIFKSGRMNILLAGVSLGLYGAGHFSEIITRAIKSNQVFADERIMRRLRAAFFSVALPQAAEDSIFDIKRLMIQLLQWTTVVGYISVNDMTRVMLQIGQRTMYPFFSIGVCIVFYLIAVILIEWLVWIIKKKKAQK